MQTQFFALPHSIALKPFEGAKGIVITEHDLGDESIVAQFYDNYLDDSNRVHRHAEMFVRVPRMVELLDRAVKDWPAFDHGQSVSVADLVDWFCTFRLEAKVLLAEAECAIVDSCTDAGIQALQLVGETDETSVLPVPNALATAHQTEGAISNAMPAFIVNVRCLLATPTDAEDESLEGKYQVTFDTDAAGFSEEKLASIALDVFHAKQGINELEEFEITVLNAHGQPVEQDENHVHGAGEGFATVEKVDDVPDHLHVQDSQLTAGSLSEQYSPTGDEEHPKYTRSDWRNEVAQENTLRGYGEWVASMIEQEVDAVPRSLVAPLNVSSASIQGGAEYFPGACVEEIGSVMMQDIVRI
jgi:hypothetical protein